MNFKENEAIYLQIAGFVCEHILSGRWNPGEKIFSVRDLAAELQVNPNTVMRSYEYLQNKEIIYNKRGLGFFVEDDAAQRIIADKKERFLKEELPVLFKTMKILNIGPGEIIKRFEKYVAESAGPGAAQPPVNEQ